jgi:hypothetical protein
MPTLPTGFHQHAAETVAAVRDVDGQLREPSLGDQASSLVDRGILVMDDVLRLYSGPHGRSAGSTATPRPRAVGIVGEAATARPGGRRKETGSVQSRALTPPNAHARIRHPRVPGSRRGGSPET